MDSLSEPSSASSGTLLGSFDVVLRVSPGSGTSGIEVRPLSVSDRVGRDLALVVSSLLFIERQIRSIGDSARFSAIASLNAACVSAREGHVVKPVVPAGARVAATYRVDLLADGSFHVNVDQKLDGILEDPAGTLSATGLALEILTATTEPHRSFFRQMLEAATSYWRVRRPSSLETTWAWAVALRQLDQLSRGNTDPFAPTQMCESCGAVRPIGSRCLRCGAEPAAARTVASSMQTVTPVADLMAGALTLGPTIAAPIPQPAPSPTEVPSPATVVPPSPRVEARPEIIKAHDPYATAAVEEVDDGWPLAGIRRRFAALVLDVASGAVLGIIGAFGLITILVSTGSFTTDGDPRPLTTLFVLGIVVLYFAFGWSKGETLGMLVTKTRLLRRDDGKPAGIPRAFLRTIGTFVSFGLGFIVFLIIWVIDNNLPSIQGNADLAVRVGAAVVGLYVIWLATGQRIIGGPERQTLADRMGGTIVAIRR